MVRVVRPQLFWNTCCFSPVSGFSKVMSNILLKFWPRWCEVAPWDAVFCGTVTIFKRFRFRLRLLKSYGSGFSSGSNFFQVPVPYLDHKKHSLEFFLEQILPFYIQSFFTRKKLISFIKFIVECE
jgi:hypothetical protein